MAPNYLYYRIGLHNIDVAVPVYSLTVIICELGERKEFSVIMQLARKNSEQSG